MRPVCLAAAVGLADGPDCGPARPLRSGSLGGTVFLGRLPNWLVMVPVIPGCGRAGRLAAPLAAVYFGQVPVPEHLHAGVELPGVCEEFLRPAVVTCCCRFPCLDGEPFGGDLGAVLLPQVHPGWV